MYKVIACLVATVSFVIFIFHPNRHAKNYSYIETGDIFSELVQNVNKNEKNGQPVCDSSLYLEFIEGKGVDTEHFIQNRTLENILPGGEFQPSHCKSLFKTAIIVPYRNRQEHLEIFIEYIHKFLQAQNIHYKIFVVEQSDNYPFNRGKLMNVGAQEAMNSNYPCLMLHDVDLLPLSIRQIYACSKCPRHLASNMDTFRYHLPYLGFTGGVFSIDSNQYRQINGMSNRFYGWGGEDDDFYSRLISSDLPVCRFPPEFNKYRMLRHKKATPSDTRWDQLEVALEKKTVDGLNSLPNNYKVVLEPLYTHIFV